MKPEFIDRVFENTNYIRTGGSPEELHCAQTIQNFCKEFGGKAWLDDFAVPMANIHRAELWIDGKQIPCKGYFCDGSETVEAPFYYLRGSDAGSLARCRGKVVMVDGYLGYWIYQDLLKNGAVGFITYSGTFNWPDDDIDQRELRSYVSNGNKIPGVNINVKTAMDLIRRGASEAKIVLEQEEYEGKSQNIILDFPGESEDTIVFSAHYDSTPLSAGVFDNMSGCIGLLGLAEYFADHPHRCSLRFVWCGCEERGLLGSKAYCAAHKEELEHTVLNINLDMIGSIMGKFIACCTAEDSLAGYINYMGMELGFDMNAYQGVYSSDSTPFADAGVPAISFARDTTPSTATIHNRYDTFEVMSTKQMVRDIDFLTAFSDRMANAVHCPVKKEIPENMKEKLDEYLARKRPEKK